MFIHESFPLLGNLNNIKKVLKRNKKVGGKPYIEYNSKSYAPNLANLTPKKWELFSS